MESSEQNRKVLSFNLRGPFNMVENTSDFDFDNTSDFDFDIKVSLAEEIMKSGADSDVLSESVPQTFSDNQVSTI